MNCFLKKLCNHERHNLYLETRRYINGEISERIMYDCCNKEIMSKPNYDLFKELINERK
jgi:hypothetical protein